MAGYSTVRSALRLSAITVAAGTILGLTSAATAQSRLERAERALARAQQEVDAARREAAVSGREKETSDDEGCGSCEGSCCGGQSCDEQARENASDPFAVASDDDDTEVADQPGQRRIERRIVVGDGPVCPTCGRPMEGGAKVRGMTLPGPGGSMRGLPGKVQVFGLGGEGPARVQTRGKVVIIGDDGERREFSFGGGDEGPARRERRVEIRRFGDEGGGPESRIEIRRFKGGDEGREEGGRERRIEIQGPGGEGLPHVFRMDGPQGGVTGKVIIVGPDGQRREFDLGGEGGTPARRRIRLQEFRDGQGLPAHLDHGGEPRIIEFHTISRGQTL